VVGQVDGVAAVPAVVLADAAGLGPDLAVHAGAVRGRGDDQRYLPARRCRCELGELAGVAADDLAGAGGAVAAGMGDPGGGQFGPPRLVLDAEGVPAEVDGFDEGGADPAHRVSDQVARGAVGADRGGGDGGEHLAGVGGGGGQVPAAPLAAGILLCRRPDRQPQFQVRAGG
jgi:hypothetical protein